MIPYSSRIRADAPQKSVGNRAAKFQRRKQPTWIGKILHDLVYLVGTFNRYLRLKVMQHLNMNRNYLSLPQHPSNKFDKQFGRFLNTALCNLQQCPLPSPHGATLPLSLPPSL